ncbi:MAG: hypothetical protein K1X29_00815 [Bdellovibrionales bacterium]|nr:hypothetical protein [Bdellovibrionales bacterium]
MAISGIVPPQAYTRETLVEAFEWLKDQPASIQEKATHAEALVGLYLTAKRRNYSQDQAKTQQRSVETFNNDLRKIAQNIEASQALTNEEPSPVISLRPSHSVPVKNNKNTIAEKGKNEIQLPLYEGIVHELDEKSQKYIRDIQQRMNLETEIDALRALVAIGYEKLNGILPS